MNEYKRKKGFLFLLFPLLFFAITGIVMWLWNALLPEIVGVKSISYWQAMGLLVLSKILFGGFHPGKRNHCKNKWNEDAIEHRMGDLSEEDREKLKEKLRERFKGNPFCNR